MMSVVAEATIVTALIMAFVSTPALWVILIFCGGLWGYQKLRRGRRSSRETSLAAEETLKIYDARTHRWRSPDPIESLAHDVWISGRQHFPDAPGDIFVDPAGPLAGKGADDRPRPKRMPVVIPGRDGRRPGPKGGGGALG